MHRSILAVLIMTFVFLTNIFAQEETEHRNLKGRHAISMGMGMRTNSSSVVVRSTSGYYPWNDNDVAINAGFLGSFAYQYWFDEEWAINFQVGVISADIDVNNWSDNRNDGYDNFNSNTIAPILMGFKYYPKMLAMGSVGRPYAGFNFGAYVGTVSRSEYWLFHETIVETVFGVEPNVGVDLFIAKWLRLGPSLTYHYHTKFKSVALEDKDAFGFMLNMGVVF